MGCGKELPEELFLLIQEKIKFILPSDYFNCIRFCDAGTPVYNQINFLDSTINDIHGTCIGNFLAFNKEENYYNNILGLYRDPPEFFPKKIVAFADDPGGNYFCFDYRQDPKTDNPPVVFWNHEGAGTEEAVSFLAKDFEAFLGMLKSEEEAEEEYQKLKAQHQAD